MPILSSIAGWFGAKAVKKALKSIGGFIGTEFSEWNSRRTKVADAKLHIELAKAEAEATILMKKATADIEWDQIQAENSKHSWKDEFWTVVLAAPIIAIFIPGLQPYVAEGFRQLEQTVPHWYYYAVGSAIAAAFGTRKITDMIGKVRKK